MIDVRVTKKGPLFDGRARAAVNAFLDDAKTTVAEEGLNMVQARLGAVLKHPTGAYQSGIHTDRQRNDRVVRDYGGVKGPWLEGTSRRNQTTRFKGYRTFRQTAQQLRERAHGIAQRRLAPYLARMQ